jgi:hypothetical protein
VINLPATFGKAFILSAFAPALLFVLLNGLFVASGGLPLLGALTIPLDTPALGGLGIKGVDLTLLLIPSVLGILLNAFNAFIIRLFEGAHGFQRDWLLKWMLDRKAKQHALLYGDLHAYREQLEKTDDELERRGLRMEIAKIHGRLYTGLDGVGFNLPHDPSRLMPTLFGNIWGVIEEYPYRRYGMDGTTFWPRMISVVPKEYADMIADEKGTLDTLLNSSLLAILFGVEMLVVSTQRFDWGNIGLAAGAFAAAYFLYQAAVSTLLKMGELIKSCYDLFRSDLIAKFGLTVPKGDIEAERKIWSGLTSYILAGDVAYYPTLPPKAGP